MPEDEPLLVVDDLVQRYRMRGETFEAVAGISFNLDRGETLGLVGESGCGKSSAGRAILQLPGPSSGTVRFDGVELTHMKAQELRAMRKKMQVVFQNPTSALNPRRRVSDIVAEGLVISGSPASEARLQAAEMLEMVGLDSTVLRRRPRELSGGQCQRVAIARALVLRPQLLVCDEPVASLDVSVQGQVLNLLEDARHRFGIAMVFISHDLSVVHQVSDRIAVMYLGKIVEIGPGDLVTKTPSHPYTRALLDAVPVADPDVPTSTHALTGEIPSPLSPPSGCRFRTRCPLAQQRCSEEVPELREISSGHFVACHFPLRGDEDVSTRDTR